ncbi:MAG TPA: tol-pal system protein YbgF [Devosia sp.]|nr:tol-pal system protein YbgF [Devosia sp.]
MQGFLPPLGLRRLAALAVVVLAALLTGNAAFAQSSRDAAQLVLRIQDLEQQVRDLTGQVQGLQFQVTQLQTLIDRSNQDNDFRFKALEGKGGGASRPSADQGSLAPSRQPATDVAPMRQAAAAPVNAPADIAPPDDQGGLAAAGDDLGPSSDPLVGRGRPGESPDATVVPLGPSAGPRGAAPQPGSGGSRSGMSLASIPPSAAAPAASNPQAEAQYKAAYDAIVKGNYTFAADQFRQFIKAYPRDPQAPDATNWLGEALLQQKDFVDAADVLVTGYKTYPNSPRAPDMLLKLGIALSGADQQAAACKTFGLLSDKFPNTTAAFKTRLKQEMARGKCAG